MHQNYGNTEEERIAKAKRCRDQALRELVETEKTYVNGLGKLIIIYMNPLRQNDYDSISMTDHQTIFPSVVNTIYNLHNQLLAELDYNYYVDSDETVSVTSKVGKVLIKYAELFKMYQLYMNGYECAQKALSIIKDKNKRFNKWLREQSVKTSLSAGNLESLLILPIQRIPRYQLLLKEIIKQTQKISVQHTDLTDLNKTYDQILQITNLIETKMKEYDNKRKVGLIETKFDNINTGDLVEPSRYYIAESKSKNDINIHKMDGSSHHIKLVLFNDCMIYGHFNEESYSSVALMKRKLHFDHLLPFGSIFKCVIEDHYKNRWCLLLYSRDYSIWISFKTKKLRAKWVKIINNANDLVNNKHIKNLQKKYMNANTQISVPYPIMVPDDYADYCQECNAKFTYISNRKHHCKQCGRLLCGECTTYRINSVFNKYKKNQIIRCCKTCKHFNTFSMISLDFESSPSPNPTDVKKHYNHHLALYDSLNRHKRAKSSPSLSVKSRKKSPIVPHRSSQPLLLHKSSTSTISMLKSNYKLKCSPHRRRKKPHIHEKYTEDSAQEHGYYNDDSFDEIDDDMQSTSMEMDDVDDDEDMPALDITEVHHKTIHHKTIKILQPTTTQRSRSYAVGLLNEYVGCIITDDDTSTDQLSDFGGTSSVPSSGDFTHSPMKKSKMERVSSFRANGPQASLQNLTTLIWV